MSQLAKSAVVTFAVIVAALTALAGCQDWARKSTPPTDLSAPPEVVQQRLKDENADVPGAVEDMLRSRQAYIEQLTRLERLYLEIGDVSRANWARRQRERTEGVEVYPYLSDYPSEATVIVAPEQTIPEADALYDRARARLNEVRGVPFAGNLPHNMRKAREALDMFRELLRKYPKSDKVDDAAFYCGEIYKEYLRMEDPDDELSIKYYRWAFQLDPKTPHAARFQCAVVEDFRRHNRTTALELYRQVLLDETHNESNLRFAASRIEQLTDEEGSHLRPRPEPEPGAGDLRSVEGPSGGGGAPAARDATPAGSPAPIGTPATAENPSTRREPPAESADDEPPTP